MPYTMEDYHRETLERIIETTPLEEILKLYTPEERMEGLSPEELMEGLSPEERMEVLLSQEYLKSLSLAEKRRLYEMLARELFPEKEVISKTKPKTVKAKQSKKKGIKTKDKKHE